MRRLTTWLGLTSPTLEDGFRTNSRGGASPVCLVCGALVAWNAQRTHADWHARVGG